MKSDHRSALNPCEILWEAVPEKEWLSYADQAPRLSLLQDPDYGAVMAALNQQRVRRGVIMIRGETAGIVQVLEAGILGNAVHGVMVDRGPAWLEGFGGLEDFALFARALRADFPRRFGRRVRFIPEIQDSPQAREILAQAGFTRRSGPGYMTFWLDLAQEEEALRRRMEKSWRGDLRKSQAVQMVVEFSRGGPDLPWVLAQAHADKAARGYVGPSLSTLQGLCGRFGRAQKLLLGVARMDNRPIAAIVVFLHGRSATYQVGVNTPQGRDVRAHHRLLWEACAELKARGVVQFDLGGANREKAAGVMAFKQGLGGQVVETAGFYA